MNKRQQAWEDHLKANPLTVMSQDDFNAGWDAAVEAAANITHDFIDMSSYLRAQNVIRMELEV